MPSERPARGLFLSAAGVFSAARGGVAEDEEAGRKLRLKKNCSFSESVMSIMSVMRKMSAMRKMSVMSVLFKGEKAFFSLLLQLSRWALSKHR